GPASTQFYTLSLHDALPISRGRRRRRGVSGAAAWSIPCRAYGAGGRSSRLQLQLLSSAGGWLRGCIEGRIGCSTSTWTRTDNREDRKSTRLNSSHLVISYAV